MQVVNDNGVLCDTNMVQVLNTQSELQLVLLVLLLVVVISNELTNLAPVATVEQLLLLQWAAVDILVEDLGHLFGCKVVQAVGLGASVECSDDSTGRRSTGKTQK